MHAKRAVEAEIAKQGFPLVTILADTDFMDNWLPHAGYSHKLYRTVLWRKTFTPEQLKTKKIMLVSTRDIGRAGAKALHEGITGRLPLAGDKLTMNEIVEQYEDCYGKKPDEAMGLAATAVKYVSSAIGGLSNVSSPGAAARAGRRALTLTLTPSSTRTTTPSSTSPRPERSSPTQRTSAPSSSAPRRRRPAACLSRAATARTASPSTRRPSARTRPSATKPRGRRSPFVVRHNRSCVNNTQPPGASYQPSQ